MRRLSPGALGMHPASVVWQLLLAACGGSGGSTGWWSMCLRQRTTGLYTRCGIRGGDDVVAGGLGFAPPGRPMETYRLRVSSDGNATLFVVGDGEGSEIQYRRVMTAPRETRGSRWGPEGKRRPTCRRPMTSRRVRPGFVGDDNEQFSRHA